MEQTIAVFVVLGLLVLVLGGAVFVLIAISRERAFTRRLDALEGSVRELSLAARQARAAEPAQAKPAPAPAPPPISLASEVPTARSASERTPPSLPDRASRPSVEPAAKAPDSATTSRPHEHAPTSTRPPLASPPPKPRVSLERTLGVTGAAILGGVVFAIAGLYLYQYSVQQGLITPAVRVAMGTVLGVVCLGGSEILRKRGYRVTADSLAGGAIVVLFAAFWAANAVFHLWPFWLAFALMGAVTALCCVLALRHASQVIAVLGLVGGFATPIALSRGEDNPIGLFGWTLLVNLGFLSVAHKRRWPMMGIIALAGTFIIEALWIFARMEPETFVLGLVVLGVFAALFVGFVALQPSSERARWISSQIGAVFLPFVFAIYFSRQSGALAGGHFYPIALLAALLCAAASWVARAPGLAFVPLGTAAGSVGLALVWVLTNDLDTARAWELVICCTAIAGVLHALCAIRPPARAEIAPAERELRFAVRGDALLADQWTSAAFAAGGFVITLAIAAIGNFRIGLWPWAAGWAALAVLHCRQGALAGRPLLPIASSVLTGLGLFSWCVTVRRSPEELPVVGLVAVLLGFVLLYQLAATWISDDRARRTAWCAAGLAPLFAMATVSAALDSPAHDPRFLLGVLLVLGACVAIAANGARSSVLFAIGAVATASALWTHSIRGTLWPNPPRLSILPEATLFVALGAALFTLWPFVRRASWTSSRSVWGVAAAASVLWFLPLKTLWTAWLTNDAIGLVPVALAAIVGTGYWLAGRGAADTESGPGTSDTVHGIARAWFASLTLFWLALALPVQLDKDWALVGLALAGASQVWLWTKCDHVPLKYAGCALLSFASAVLVLSRFDGTYPIHEAKLVNWLAWQYLAPAVAAVLASTWLAPRELARMRPTEKSLYANGVPWCASLCGLCAAGLVFAWLNLAILNAFGTMPKFQWLSERVPARDLTMSLAWALYALSLLVLGVNRRIGGLRWISLGLFMLTIAKVFLFDLGNLQGLYRVASLFGLAIALLLVSILYQRFVFRVARTSDEPALPPAPAGP